MPSVPVRIPRRHWLINAAAAAGAAAVAACDRNRGHQDSRRVIRIGIDLWAGYYPVLIAFENGWFAEVGLDVRIEIPENTSKVLANFAAMNLDAIAVALGDIINVTQRNPNVRAVMVSDQSDGGDIIVGRRPFAGPESVRGKRIGTNLGGFGEILVRAFVERHGLRFDEIELVDVDAAEAPKQLRAGLLEIVHTWEPYGSQALNDGNHLWFSSSEVPGLIPSCVAFQKRAIDERRGDVAAFLAIWQRAQTWFRENIDDGLKVAARHPRVEAAGATLAGVRLVDREENRRIFTRGSGSDCVFDVADYYIEHFTSRGMLTRPPRPDDFIDPSFMVST